MCGIIIFISSTKMKLKKCSITHPKRFPSNTCRQIHPFLLPLKIESQFHSLSGLFTTTSSRLKLHSYSAPGMPAAMQQSKQNVILYHLHPWECRNEEGRRVDWKKGREKQLGDREERRETRIYNHWDWVESMMRVEG